MKQLTVSEMSLVLNAKRLSFKEKIEIARHLDRLRVAVIEMPAIVNPTTDSLLIRTVAAFVKNSKISVETAPDLAAIEMTASALASAKNCRIRLCLPVSAVLMEYQCHLKPHKMIPFAEKLFAAAKNSGIPFELYAVDATRSETEFLKQIIELAVQNGVETVTLCDSEGAMLPDEFQDYLQTVKNDIPALQNVQLGVVCRSESGLASASCLMAVKSGVEEILCAVGSREIPDFCTVSSVLNHRGSRLGVSTSLDYNNLQRITGQIGWILGLNQREEAGNLQDEALHGGAGNAVFQQDADREEIVAAVKDLGYDLSEEDLTKVYEEFCRVNKGKSLGIRELEAIVASTALQVPPTYRLENYVINNGNIITASAQITLTKDEKTLTGICTGDGPVDAAFRALEQIIGRHYELDDFQIQAVTEGREAMGSALVRLRHNGKIFSGNGISTDIIGSSIRAFLNAVNKIVYEEGNNA
ncbi:MAG: hypothetical protein IKI29_06800 [Clostridia bacterium]|nr:hypothetical protein [Clostridia bacterium]